MNEFDRETRSIWVAWLSLFAAIAVVVFLVLSCDDTPTDAEGDFARGGVKGKPVEVVLDSITVLPPDTTVAPGDSYKIEVLYWINGEQYPRIRCPDDLVYPFLGDLESSCPIEPEPVEL